MGVMPDNGRIFVSIPSYRDPECQYTVLDLFSKARQPHRVRIGICWQADHQEDASCFLLNAGSFAPQVRILFLHHSQARGPCLARALIQQELYRDEEFYFQLDSHFRMIEGWDEALVAQWQLCGSAKAILTTYPSSYTLPEDYKPGGPDRAQLHPGTSPVLLCAREFGELDGFLRIVGKICCPQQFGASPRLSTFWAAGFAFSRGEVVREVPYDIGLEDLFFGEESVMAARLWTSGWDFWAPARVIGYHLWTRRHRPIFREHSSEERSKRVATSQDRVRKILAGELLPASEALGLGAQRTLREWEDFCGVNFAQRSLTDRARRGGADASLFVDGDPAAVPVLQAPDLPSKPDQVSASSSSKKPQPVAASPLPVLDLLPDKAAEALKALLGGDAMVSRQASSPSRPPKLFKEHTGKPLQLLNQAEVVLLEERGFVVLEGFLQRAYSSLGSPAAELAATLVREGALEVPLRPAQLGRGSSMWMSAAVRGDEMAWLSMPEGAGLRARAELRLRRASEASAAKSEPPQDEFEALGAALKSAFGGTSQEPEGVVVSADEAGSLGRQVEQPGYEDLDILLTRLVQLRGEVDEALGFHSQRMSMMIARYPGGGAYYTRHRDALPEHAPPRRRLTMVYYLNPEWSEDHGGCLRMYLLQEVAKKVQGAAPMGPGRPGEFFLDVEPRMDRLLLFASEWLEHEVLPSYSERLAVTGWLY